MQEILDSTFAGQLRADGTASRGDMSRETLRVHDESLSEPASNEAAPDQRQGTLAARFSELQGAYEALLVLVKGYELERAEIRDRLARLLALLGTIHVAGGS